MSQSTLGVAASLALVLALSLGGCGGEESISTTAPSAGDPPAEEVAGSPPVKEHEEASTAARIQFVDGFAAGAAKAKPGEILFVYVGRHDPT